MPAKLSKFYRYEGSLTTPPCYESVIWTLFNETIEIAEEQVNTGLVRSPTIVTIERLKLGLTLFSYGYDVIFFYYSSTHASRLVSLVLRFTRLTFHYYS